MRILVLTSCLLLGATATAQRDGTAPTSDESNAGNGAASRAVTTREEIDAKRKELKAEIAALERQRDGLPTDAEIQTRLRTELERLRQVDDVLGRQEAELQRGEEAQAGARQARQDLADLASTPPVATSFAELDSILDEVAAMRQRVNSQKEADSAARRSLDAARKTRDERESERRAAKETVEQATEPEARAVAGEALRLAEIASRLAMETVTLREIELSNVARQEEAARAKLDLLLARERRFAAIARFTREDLDKRLEKLAADETALRRRLDAARRDLDHADRELGAVRARRDAAIDPPAALLEELEASRLRRETRQVGATLLGDALEWLAMMRRAWNRRYQVFNQLAPEAEQRAWAAEAQADLERLQLATQVLGDETAAVRNSLVSLQQRTESVPAEETLLLKWLRDQSRELSEQIKAREAGVQRIAEARQLLLRHKDELDVEIASVTVVERLRQVWRSVGALWNHELTSVDDRPITVAKVVIGLLLVVLGGFIARVVTGFLGRRVLPRFGLDEGAVAALQTILFYVLVISVCLLALRTVNVPLTAFTILGGALAIGVGFGSQNLMNNFISGLILLVERPIRVGDLIDVESVLGVVEHIGLRSTRVKKPSNVDIIVPNSTFLQSNVINWTLSDDRYRTYVSVGVAYGSNTREVSRLLYYAVEEHGRVLKKPDPIVLFTDFGDNALIFEVHFWIRMRRDMERRTIESDIRHRIDGLFDDAGITIAFPQRDVHLDASAPLEVRMVRGEVRRAQAEEEEAPYLP